MQVTHLKTYSVPIAAVQPPSGWRRGLRGTPPNGEGAMLRIGTARPSTCADSSTLRSAAGGACRPELMTRRSPATWSSTLRKPQQVRNTRERGDI